MRKCPVLLAAFGLLVAGPAAAQPPKTYSDPLPPDRATLDRLHLTTEWVAALPLAGRQDAVASVQVVDEDQVFIQTRAGVLSAIDARTGAKQWSVRYPVGHVNVYPVAVNDRYVFAVNVTRLLCYHRATGLLEFDHEIKLANEQNAAPTSGPVADRDNVYVVVNGSIAIGYRVPEFLRITERRGAERQNTARLTADRYASTYANTPFSTDRFERPLIPDETMSGVGMGNSTANQTPSMSALPRVSPPYTLGYRSLYATPNLTVVPSLRQPYNFRPDYMQFNQITPSISTIPPSIARANELSNLRPRPIGPTQEWLHSLGSRVVGELLLSAAYARTPDGRTYLIDTYPHRLWMAGAGTTIEAVDAKRGRPQVVAEARDVVASPVAGGVVYDRTGRRRVPLPQDAGLLGFVGLVDGTLLAIDLGASGPENGRPGPARIEWRATLGGLLNRKPLATADAVYASGDHAGVAKVDALTGEVIWRTESAADRILAVNEEFAYVLDRLGNLLVYDARKATDPETRRSAPLATLNVGGFNVPVTNSHTDRLFLTADNGTLICLRDASTKYARPVRMGVRPIVTVAAPAEAAPPEAAPAALPPEPPKKDEPKKDAPKKDG
jgi:outer membrane protein assembly factor BamB